MTSSDRQETQAILNAYIDGEMDPTQLKEFKQTLAENENLRIELELQQKIDEVLARLFIPSSNANSSDYIAKTHIQQSHETKTSSKGSGIFVLRKFATAAAIAGGIFGSWLIWDSIKPSNTGRPLWQTIEAVYTEVEAEQIELWRCEDEAEFIEVFKDGFNQPLLLPFDTPPGIKVVGLAYRFTISPYTICLISTINDKPVVVYIDRIEAGARPALTLTSELNLFERRVGKLVLYELTPMQEPSLLDLFYIPTVLSDDAKPKVQENG